MLTMSAVLRPLRLPVQSFSTNILCRNVRAFHLHDSISTSSMRYVQGSIRRDTLGPLSRQRMSLISRRSYNNSYEPNFDPTGRSVKRAIQAIILLNGAVFVAWQYAGLSRNIELHKILRDYATVSWENIKANRWFTTLTSAFSHNEIGHISFNMLSLYAFSTIVGFVPGVGGPHFWAICIGSAVVGSICQLWHVQAHLPGSTSTSEKGPLVQHQSQNTVFPYALGASGMVMGVGAVATLFMPHAPMRIFFIPFSIPLWLMAILYAGFDAYALESNDGVGHAAHLGGALFGALYYTVFLRKFGGILAPRSHRW